MVNVACQPLDNFLHSLAYSNWFAHLGEELSQTTSNIANCYLKSLNTSVGHITIVKSWHEAQNTGSSLNEERAHTPSDTAFRRDLKKKAEQAHSSATCIDYLNSTYEVVSNIAQDINSNIEAYVQEKDADFFLNKAAAGAFAEASYDNAIWILAQAEQLHPIHLKFLLFQQGRWPIGIKEESFFLW